MKSLDLSTSKQKQVLKILAIKAETLAGSKIKIDLDDIVSEDVIRNVLCVSQRTMYNYRRHYNLYHIKCKGKIFYSKTIFMLQLLNKLK